jgi:hypothetical protein
VVAVPVRPVSARAGEPAESEPPAEGDALEEAAEAEAAEQEPGEPDPITKSLIDDAVAHFKEGRRLYEERSYPEAAEAFRRSYESVRSGQALYNESLAWEKAGEPARALEALDRYLALPECEPGELLCAADRDSASRAAQKLKPLVGELDIVLEPGVAIRGVEIAGELHGLTAFPVYVEPGLLEVVAVGIKENQRRRFEVEVEAGKEAFLLVGPFPQGGGVIPPVRPPEGDNGGNAGTPRRDPELRRKRLRYAFYGSLAATIGSGAALGVVGGLLLDARRDYDRRCTGECGMRDPVTGEWIVGDDGYHGADKRRFDRLQPAATALVITTSALALTTVTLALFAFAKGDRSPQRASTRAPKPGAQFTGSGVRVRW